MAEIDPHENIKGTAFTHQCYTQVYPAVDPTLPEHSQTGKVIVITGASRGLGQEGFATSFARANPAGIALIGRSEPGLAKTAQIIKEINPEIKVLSLSLDVTNEAAVNKAFQEITSILGVPQVLINNAGIVEPVKLNLESDVEDWWNTQVVNVKGVFIATKAFVKETGGTPAKPTTIINLTSMSSQGVPPILGSYSISKMAVNKLTAYINSEHPEINCFILDPGVVKTDMAVTVPYLLPFAIDSPLLPGGTAVWLSSGNKKFLSGRYIMSSWNVKELEARSEEIQKRNLLTFALKGEFGLENIKID